MRRIFFATAFVVTFSAGALATLAVQRWTTGADIALMVARAKTPADHEALASYFEKEAADSRSKAAFHARLSHLYNASHPDWKLARHCEEVSQSFNEISEQDSALATEHRKLSEESK